MIDDRCVAVLKDIDQGPPEGLSEQGWNRVADLPQPVGGVPSEAEAIGERLNPGGLADREGAVLLWVDVPVAILRQVGGDAAA